jgi:hypothetical protein
MEKDLGKRGNGGGKERGVKKGLRTKVGKPLARLHKGAESPLRLRGGGPSFPPTRPAILPHLFFFSSSRLWGDQFDRIGADRGKGRRSHHPTNLYPNYSRQTR